MTTLREHGQPATDHAREDRGIVIDVDRTRSVRRARRHSALVRASRVGLPAAAAAIVLFYGATMIDVAGWRDVGGKIELPRVLPEHLTMNNPRYRGFTKEGGEYEVQAKTATQDLGIRGLIRMRTVSAVMRNRDKGTTRLDAKSAIYFSQDDKMRLLGNIRVSAPSGGWARLTIADIDLKNGITTSRQPVAVGNSTGTIRASTMTIRQKTKEITFAGTVKTRMQPAARAEASAMAPSPDAATPAGELPASNPTSAPQQQAGDAIGRIFSGGKGPVEIDADRLDIDDVNRTATFTGNVKARRGAATLEAPELRIAYDGSPSGGLTGAGAQVSSGAPAGAKAAIKSIVTSGPVTITEGADTRVAAAAAAFDAASSLATLTGGVVIDRAPQTKITGRTASFNSARDVASIDGDVVIASGADRRATGDHLEFNNTAKTGLLTGDLVLTQGPNVLKGRQLTMDQSNGRSVLTAPAADGRGPAGRIAARLTPPAAATKGKSKPKETEQASTDGGGMHALSNFRTDPSAPVAIAADALELNEKSNVAIFRGDVVTEQGETTIRSAELHANYTGSAGLSAATQPRTAGAGSGEAAKVTRIQARGKVVVTSKGGQKATGDWADFDTTANTVTLGGDVVLSQGRNVVRGNRLVVDLLTGEAVIKTDNAAAPEISSEKPGGGWQATRKPSRPSAVFFPKAAENAAAAAAAKAKPAAPGWQTTTGESATPAERN
ncbi:MAG: LPS export ABC transporter periplasmic protein LptC [Hyphomicrobiaceae bacterium]|nr:LPS export ABC transporter periplasmic protein LptC [Hyphomicrobiaceae bacterium]